MSLLPGAAGGGGLLGQGTISPATNTLPVPGAQRHSLEAYKPPEALKWCESGDLYFVRLATEIGPGGKHAKRAFAITEERLYVCEPRGTLLRAIKVPLVSEVFVQTLELKKGMISKSQEVHVLLKVPSEKDVLFALTHDKDNGPEGNDTGRFVAVLKELSKSLTGHALPVTELDSDAAESVLDRCQHEPASGYVDTREVIAAKRKQKEEEQRQQQEHCAQLEQRVQHLTRLLEEERSKKAPSSVTALQQRVQELEQQLGQQAVAQRSSGGEAMQLRAEVDRLRAQLDEERACREDMVRDMRSEFDTEFIKKQADEFELRQRAHQRLRDKDQSRIKELEERLAEPRQYSGSDELAGRIRALERRLEAADARHSEVSARCIHFENVADEQYAHMRKYWDFINEGLLRRIRDLTAGKDPKTLPLLPQMPKPPIPPQEFRYDPAAPPKRKAHSDPKPAASGGGVDLDLDLGPDAAASKAVDLDDDLDLDAAPKAAAVDDDLL
eukprot:TRINITY_DN47357_c0_g1_i1.p1 TRINITY_DN47357_c0_g1~~TRINITY_DN47357_c0_g1_i1.p1  ORF type:complete len:498 (+),score=165.04 TRINITY_DN47357_c0_g1_i1:65-1558(+)